VPCKRSTARKPAQGSVLGTRKRLFVFFSKAAWAFVLVGTLVASFAALFLSKLKTPVEQSAESPHPPNSFDQRCEKAKPRSPTAVRIGSYPPPPTTEGAEDEDKEERFLKRGNFIAGIVTALIALGLLSVTYRYTKYTYKMWQEMQSQTKTAREQLELSERPWIKVNFTIGSQGFAFQEAALNFLCKPTFKTSDIPWRPALSSM